ncbi:MAG: hypothetical protein WD492_06675 [Alkalispirochaeta sp.]
MTTSGWRRVGGLACGLLFLAACSENADLFSSLDDQAEPELSTLEAGTVMGEGESFEVQIEYPSDEASRATSMRVELRDPEGTVHSTVEFDAAELAEPRLPFVEFSQPPEGVYVLVTEAWIHGQQLFSDRRQIFITSVAPRVGSVTIHPTSIRREMQALAVAEVDYAASTRPYMRWIFDGSVAAEGYLEDGLDRAVLDGAGRNAGAYRVSLEVYPWGVEEGTVIDGSTTITADSDVVVREEMEPGPPDFAQREPGNVVRYFSFDGTRQAWTGASTDPVEATVEGEVSLDMLSGALGVRISSQGIVTVPIPVPDESDSMQIVAMRLSSTSTTGGFPADPVVSLSGSAETGPPVPITIENGVFVLYPPGTSPIPLAAAPDKRDLITLQFLLRNENGETFLEPALNDAASVWSINLGPDSGEASLAVRGWPDHQIFLDRITVTHLSVDQFRAELVDRATERFVASFGDRLRAWAIAVPDEQRTALPPIRDDYTAPDDAVDFGAESSPTMNALLPDGGALVVRAENDSGASVTLRRRGHVLELTDERSQQGRVSRIDIPGDPDALGRFSLHRITFSRVPGGDEPGDVPRIRVDEDESGEFITLFLPEALRSAGISVVPDAAQADYPVWVGRWAR